MIMEGNITMSTTKIITKVVIILIILLYLNINSVANNNELLIQWDQPKIIQKLVRGENITYNNYTITVNGFSKPVTSNFYSKTPDEDVLPFVELNISNKTFTKIIPLILQDYYITPDNNIKIKATLLPSKSATEWVFESYAPWVILEISPKGVPNIIANIETDFEEYQSTSDITATIFIENTGTADLSNINLKIDSNLITEKTSYTFDDLIKGESIEKKVIFQSPYINTTTYNNILINITATDIMNNQYTTTIEKTILITPETQPTPELKKSLPSKIYLKNNVMITLYMENKGRTKLKNITVTDIIPYNFEQVTKGELKWVISIDPNSYWDTHYIIKPTDISKDGYILPSTTAILQLNNIQTTIHSNQPKVVINGPKILLTKDVDATEFDSNITEKMINVTIQAKNIGNTPTKVVVIDTLPQNSILNSGTLQAKDFLEANKEITFKYSFTTLNLLPIILPKANAQYYELGSEGKLLSINSTEIIITEKPIPIIEPPKRELTIIEQILEKYLNVTTSI